LIMEETACRTLVTRKVVSQRDIWPEVKGEFMGVRRATMVSLGISGVIFGAVVNAPSALAASATANCTAVVTSSVNLTTGETFTLTVDPNCTDVAPGMNQLGSATYGSTGTESALPANTWTAVTPTVKVIYSQPVCGTPVRTTAFLYTSSNASGPADLGTYSIYFTPTACNTGAETPVSVLQQVGVGTDGTCAATLPADLNWGGADSGGWGRSWAQWVNGGNGGAVCTRTLVYSTSQSKWMIG
jgi:hypothetical protein